MKKMLTCLLVVGSMTSFAKNVETIKSNIYKLEDVVINNANDIDEHKQSAKEINQTIRQAIKDIKAIVQRIPAPIPTPRQGRGGNGGGRGANRPSPAPVPGYGNGHSRPTTGVINMILVNSALSSCSNLSSIQSKTCYKNFLSHEVGILASVAEGCFLSNSSSSKTCYDNAISFDSNSKMKCFKNGSESADMNGFYIGPYVRGCASMNNSSQASQCFDRALMAISL